MTHDTGLIHSLAVISAIIALCCVGLLHIRPPDPQPATADADVFSASRAVAHLPFIARKPHPIGTPENDRVRDYLIVELRKLGLQPQVQKALGLNARDRQPRVGLVNNVLVRIPGRTSGNALLLAAHYDSTPTGPGAADDGASVAAMLETLRALKNLPPLQNDLICIFTDGEEAGLLGADAFVHDHPWARDVKVALNFEYRGNRGPFLMFETSAGNGRLIDGFASAVAQPLANSLMYEFYRRLPNDTDLTVFKRAGIAGMNFAAIEGHTRYHTQLDRPELLAASSVQHQGDLMLSLVQQFGNRALDDLRAGDRVYFDFPGLGLLHYPAAWAIPLWIGLVMLFATVLVLGLRSGQLRFVRTTLSLLTFFAYAWFAAFVAQWLWAFIEYLHPDYRLMPHGDTYNSHWYLPAFVLLAVALFGFAQLVTTNWLCPMESAAGAMAAWLILLGAVSIALPGASFLFCWPLAPMLLAVGAWFWLHDRLSPSALWIAIFVAAMAPGIVMFTAMVKLLFVGLTPKRIGIVIGFLALVLGLVTPSLHLLMRGSWLRWPALLCALALLMAGSSTGGFDDRQPRPNHLFYLLDAGTNKALWLSADPSLDGWSRTFFPGHPEHRPVPELLGDLSRTYWLGPAPVLPLAAPTVEIVEDSVDAGVRSIVARIVSKRHAPEMRVSVEGAGVIGSAVEGRQFSREFDAAWHLRTYGFAQLDLNIKLAVKAGLPVKLRIIDVSYGLPKTSTTSRPVGMIAQPFELSDATAVVSTFILE